ncbi:MAG: polysaccharide biosynthesis protein, partial [Candidatus Omnitrophica bacterium]|nr:polysaccharide biosynthesis protein [Candidatus Omnitrophota bacterium]
PITDIRMTRFLITLEQGVELVWRAFEEMVGGEIFVPKIPSVKVVDIARAIAPNAKLKIVGIRPGEKIHEYLISEEDARNTYEYDSYYKILPAIYDWHHSSERIGNGRKCKESFVYSSNTNPHWISQEEFQALLDQEYPTELNVEALS